MSDKLFSLSWRNDKLKEALIKFEELLFLGLGDRDQSFLAFVISVSSCFLIPVTALRVD